VEEEVSAHGSLTFSGLLFSVSAGGEPGDLTAVTALQLPGLEPLRSAVSTLMSRCFGDTNFTSGEPVELGPVEEEKGMFMFPAGVYGSSKSSSFWSLYAVSMSG